MSEFKLSVKVSGLEKLRETVALLKELKELGVGNIKVQTEVQSPQLWVPDNSGWIEHDGKSVPEGTSFYILTLGERERRSYGNTICRRIAWTDEFMWKGLSGNNVVAYKVVSL